MLKYYIFIFILILLSSLKPIAEVNFKILVSNYIILYKFSISKSIAKLRLEKSYYIVHI